MQSFLKPDFLGKGSKLGNFVLMLEKMAAAVLVLVFDFYFAANVPFYCFITPIVIHSVLEKDCNFFLSYVCFFLQKVF